MVIRKALALSVVAIALFFSAHKVSAQVGISIGMAPGCPYGYFDYEPYQCAPYGYYGPDWFNGGIFIGAGPWFHGGRGFYGHVDNRYDPHHGYGGPLPGRGNVGNPGHEGGGEHALPGYRGGGGSHGGGGGERGGGHR